VAGLPRQARARGPVLGRSNWQMAPGERAAIEGLLSGLKPRLSIEIGTAQGGSLERIAAHSDEVHTFDLGAEVEQDAFPNVTFHRGDNHVLLPRLLDRLEREGRNVDFVLVDADHTREGVRRDLEDLLASRAVRRTYIVLHDTMNEDVARGLAAVDLDAHPNVVFVDFGFVALRQAPRGLQEIWGGLGLVICDVDASLGVVPERRDHDDSLRAALAVGIWRLLAPTRAAKQRAKTVARRLRRL
jgi:predicted component of type VI protein secretion system